MIPKLNAQSATEGDLFLEKMTHTINLLVALPKPRVREMTWISVQLKIFNKRDILRPNFNKQRVGK